MRTPLDDVSFVTRSPHRVTVLEALTREGLTPNGLKDETGISRATIGRVLGNFEERGWVRRSGRVYARTAFGALLCEELTALLETVDTMQRLENVIKWLPTDDFDFPLDRFAGADVTLPKPNDSLPHLERALAFFRRGGDLRVLAHGFVPQALDATWEVTIREGNSLDIVFVERVVDTIRSNPDTAAQLDDLCRYDRAAVYRYEGTAPCTVAIHDEEVGFGVTDDRGAPQAWIETDDAAIRSWAHSWIDGYRDRAHPIDPDDRSA